MQNHYSYYTNSPKKNVISVCVCVLFLNDDWSDFAQHLSFSSLLLLLLLLL